MTLPPAYWIDFASNFFPVGAGLYKRRWIVKEQKMFFFFTVAALSSELITSAMAMNHIRNLWVLQIYSLVAYTLLALVFAQWQSKPQIATLIRYSAPAYALIWIAMKLFGIEGMNDPPSITHATASTALTIISLTTLFVITRGDTAMRWWSDTRFWVASGVLLYFAGNVMLFVVLDKLALLRFADAMTIWIFHWGIDAVANVFYTIALMCPAQE